MNDSFTHHQLLFLMLVNIVIRVPHALNLLGVFVRDLNAKLLFKTHHEFHRVQRVGAEVVNKSGVWRDLVFIDTKLVDDNLLYLVLDLLIGHRVCSSVSLIRLIHPWTARVARVASKLATSSTLRHFTSRFVCRISPDNTLPGPTSITVSTPSPSNNCIDSNQRTGAETCLSSASRNSSGAVVTRASTFVTTG